MEILNYTQLPNPEKLKEILISQAALDSIMVDKEESWLRVINFYKNYSEDIDMVKIDNGAGDHMFFLFSNYGTIIKGFDHDSILSPYANDDEEIAKGIYDFVPKELMNLLDESIERDDVTFCIWRSKTDLLWKKSEVIIPADYQDGDDGEGFLLGLILTSADSWVAWARDYYEEQGERIQLDYVKKVYKHEGITKDLIEKINPDRDTEAVIKELKEIGFIKEI